MTATSRCPALAPAPAASTKVAGPAAVSSVPATPPNWSSTIGERPSCPRQRLTLASAPPTAPGKKLTVTAAVAPSLPATEKLLNNIGPGVLSSQFDGALHFGTGLPAASAVVVGGVV